MQMMLTHAQQQAWEPFSSPAIVALRRLTAASSAIGLPWLLLLLLVCTVLPTSATPATLTSAAAAAATAATTAIALLNFTRTHEANDKAGEPGSQKCIAALSQCEHHACCRQH